MLVHTGRSRRRRRTTRRRRRRLNFGRVLVLNSPPAVLHDAAAPLAAVEQHDGMLQELDGLQPHAVVSALRIGP
jgi:hypothetical protein